MKINKPNWQNSYTLLKRATFFYFGSNNESLIIVTRYCWWCNAIKKLQLIDVLIDYYQSHYISIVIATTYNKPRKNVKLAMYTDVWTKMHHIVVGGRDYEVNLCYL